MMRCWYQRFPLARSQKEFRIVPHLKNLFFGGREATTGNTSAVRRLGVKGNRFPIYSDLRENNHKASKDKLNNKVGCVVLKIPSTAFIFE